MVRQRLRVGFATLALVGAAVAAYAAPPPSAASRPPADGPPRMIVAGDGVTRTLDCKGADVSVDASNSTVTLTGCDSVRIGGDRNHVSATLMQDSDILVLGNHNVVRWTPAAGFSPVVRDQGHNNTTAPY